MTRFVACLIVLVMLAASVSRAEDQTPLQTTRQAAIAAFESGDQATALALSEQAVAIARATPDTPAPEFAHALSALAFVLTMDGAASLRARSLWIEALAVLGETGQMGTEAGATVRLNLAGYELGHGHRDLGLARLDAALGTARGTPLHGIVAQATGDLFLQNHAYPQAILALGELTEVAPELLSATYFDLYARLTKIGRASCRERV